MLAGLDRSPGIALMCLNDDLERDYDEVSRYLIRWFEKKWGTPAAWEADLRRDRRRALDAPPL